MKTKQYQTFINKPTKAKERDKTSPPPPPQATLIFVCACMLVCIENINDQPLRVGSLLMCMTYICTEEYYSPYMGVKLKTGFCSSFNMYFIFYFIKIGVGIVNDTQSHI